MRNPPIPSIGEASGLTYWAKLRDEYGITTRKLARHGSPIHRHLNQLSLDSYEKVGQAIKALKSLLKTRR